MAKLQTGHSFDGTQCGISGEKYSCLVTSDDTPVVKDVQEGTRLVHFRLSNGLEWVEESLPAWLLGWGYTPQEAWEIYWDDNPSEAPQGYYDLKKKVVDLEQELQKANRLLQNLLPR